MSPYAGTTRDVIESSLDIFGYPIVLRYSIKMSIYVYLFLSYCSDTAGLRQVSDPVEKEGIERAIER